MNVDLYWIIAISSTGLLVILVLLSLVGIDLDGLEIDLGDSFSFSSLAAFFCIGGWTGYLGSNNGLSSMTLLLISLSTGISGYIGSLLILKRMKRLESSGNINLANAIGKIGKVYLTIPAAGNGSGQIQIIIQGRLKTINAVTFGEKIQTGTKIIVFDIMDKKLAVEPYSEP